MYPIMTSCVRQGTTNLGPVVRLDCGEGQTEGATGSATLQQGLIQRLEHVDHGVGIEVGDSRIVFLATHPPTPGRHFVPRESRVRVWVRIWGY
jgi:hypothetical protein